ncbi:endolytic transglycosylase MltG [Commensalibacter papalotli (ex Botero et al. 2024)]|uniref:Endolytic murein transglycosylase n=1 Tax=Commensalibacter papalotli (ex Botero et al. 2024) TaxID=2972766 RepID=A0ABM9HQU8_9PROT|nr:endolytic transglycosylase MltG [Commensalibacter papalotli (ex Botero et al. 2024)]CAI3945066.1 Endolytic transglycosylase MltG [Commensalibacter papalotli (ex Botero et al. 2024)]CAI3945801.1 Endolytic transglycosylase MltG [Commensalibacter papalotli (ex Botero et al. 2024)]
MRKFVIVLGALLVFLGVVFVFGKSIYSKPGILEATKNVVIPKGNTNTVLSHLQKEHVLAQGFLNKFVFQAAVRITADQGALRAAEFSIPKQASIQQILQILRHAKPVQHELMIPEGLTRYQVVDLINQAPFLVGKIEVPAEGSILPQTYAYEFGYSREKLLAHMQDALQKTLNQVWKDRKPLEAVKTPQDLLTIASIVEKETAVSRERPMIARVFINRLQKKMRLQSDPTVIYALTDGHGKLDRLLTRKDWEIESPYNTYWTDALPPTPICSPGKAALEAVAHPADGNMIYFVANGTGGHSFSSSLSEHNHNVALRKQKK